MLTKCKRLWDYCEQFYTNKLDNLEEMDTSLEIYKLPRLNHEEMENMNKPGISKEIESIIWFTDQGEFYQTFKEKLTIIFFKHTQTHFMEPTLSR